MNQSSPSVLSLTTGSDPGLEIPADPTALYRFFAQDGQLLYVGITINPAIRWHQHSKNKPDWRKVAVVRLEHHENREDALDAERQAIQTELPLWNIQHKLSPVVAPRLRVRPRATRALVASVAELEEKVRSGKWLTTGEMAKLLGIGRTKVHTLLTSGAIGHRKLPGAPMKPQRECNPEDVLRLLEDGRREYRGETEESE